ncbi:MAG TPA: hypothetical protein VHL53_11670 [Acidimicrobiia bacterium]|nr:hypothetical protein [Acidimicrobiia bacterium]
MNRRPLVFFLAVLALVASAACQSDNKVGNKSLLDFKEQANNRLGETTTTTAGATPTTAAGQAAATTTTRATAKSAGPTTTTTTTKAGTAAPATPATTAPAVTRTFREIAINGDDAPLPLDPQVQTAFTGSIIRWVNRDKVPRSVRADSGQFASPLIQPGQSWDYTAATAGVFAYSDDTRPYVHGELRVSKP